MSVTVHLVHWIIRHRPFDPWEGASLFLGAVGLFILEYLTVGLKFLSACAAQKFFFVIYASQIIFLDFNIGAI